MIIKHQPRRGSDSPTRYIQDLINYVSKPEAPNRQEKCVHFIARNFMTTSLIAQQLEMTALATSGRAKQPIEHFILSFKQSEIPTSKQVDEAVHILLDEFRMKKHQVMYGLHQDTDNVHCHVVINRVDPVTEKSIEINKGLTHIACARAAARIEHAQGWQPEPNALFTVMENGKVAKLQRGESKRVKLNSEAQRFEARQGEKSVQRIAAERALPVLLHALSWDELHVGLNEIGMRFEKAGAGAKLLYGEIAIKPSSLHKNASLGNLQKRLGGFEEATLPANTALEADSIASLEPVIPAMPLQADHGRAATTVEPDITGRSVTRKVKLASSEEMDLAENDALSQGVKRSSVVVAYPAMSNRPEPEPLPTPFDFPDLTNPGQGSAHWQSFARARDQYKARHDIEKQKLRVEQQAEWQQLLKQQRQERDRELAGNWRGRGPLLNAMRQVIAEGQHEEKAVLHRQQLRDRKLLSLCHRPFPDFETWLAKRISPERAQQWRLRKYALVEPGWISGIPRQKAVIQDNPRDLRSFITEPYGHSVRYFRPGERRQPSGFIDHGQKIRVNGVDDRDTILAALQLAQQKFQRIEITGTVAFKATCAELAARYGFDIANVEMQGQIQAAQQRIARENTLTEQLASVTAFKQLDMALRADRYQLVVERHRQDGGSQTEVVTPGYQADRVIGFGGFRSAELPAQLLKLLDQPLQRAQVQLLPQSHDYDYVVLPQVSPAGLAQIQQAGLAPCLVTGEHEAENHEVVFKVGRASQVPLALRQAALKQLTQQYRHQFGRSGSSNQPDAQIIGIGLSDLATHAPGDGGRLQSVNTNQLLIGQDICCTVSQDHLNALIRMQMEQASLSALSGKAKHTQSVFVSNPVEKQYYKVIADYQIHYRDIQAGQGNLPESQQQTEIALRLKCGGHGSHQIEHALRYFVDPALGKAALNDRISRIMAAVNGEWGRLQQLQARQSDELTRWAFLVSETVYIEPVPPKPRVVAVLEKLPVPELDPQPVPKAAPVHTQVQEAPSVPLVPELVTSSSSQPGMLNTPTTLTAEIEDRVMLSAGVSAAMEVTFDAVPESGIADEELTPFELALVPVDDEPENSMPLGRDSPDVSLVSTEKQLNSPLAVFSRVMGLLNEVHSANITGCIGKGDWAAKLNELEALPIIDSLRSLSDATSTTRLAAKIDGILNEGDQLLEYEALYFAKLRDAVLSVRLEAPQLPEPVLKPELEPIQERAAPETSVRRKEDYDGPGF